MVRKLGLLLGMVLCVMYLLNPTAGLFEFIPDNIPGVGNIDEGAAGALLFYLFRKWRQRSGLPTDLDPTPAPRPSQPKIIDVQSRQP